MSENLPAGVAAGPNPVAERLIPSSLAPSCGLSLRKPHRDANVRHALCASRPTDRPRLRYRHDTLRLIATSYAVTARPQRLANSSAAAALSKTAGPECSAERATLYIVRVPTCTKQCGAKLISRGSEGRVSSAVVVSIPLRYFRPTILSTLIRPTKRSAAQVCVTSADLALLGCLLELK
jgi:hypothetical protein